MNARNWRACSPWRDWKGVLGAAESLRISACGASSIAALLAMVGTRCDVQILARARSRDEEQDPRTRFTTPR